MEVQDERPSVEIPLDCVGFRGIRKRLLVTSDSGVTLVASIDVCVSLPGTQRGAHLSRNYYAILEAVGETDRAESIEYYLSRIARRLLELHPYATRARVTARTQYFVDPGTPGLPPGEEPVEVEATVERSADGRESWELSVSVYGMTACPSAQRTIREMLATGGIAPTHSQRARLTLTIRTGPGPIVRIESLARAAFRAFSAPTKSLLKRPDEAQLVLAAHRNPKLAEDVVRDALILAAQVLDGARKSDDTVVAAEIESYESIHPQNVVARAELTLGALRRLLRRPDRDLD